MIRVITLGTGNPLPTIHRFGPSTLIQANGKNFLFDVGRGSIQRLFQVNTPFEDVDKVFLTHLHSDHMVGFPDLLLTGWVFGRVKPLQVWGPAGTQAFVDNILKAFVFDINARKAENGRPDPIVKVTEMDKEGVIYDSDGVKITVFLVDHSPVVPAYGFRLDYNGKSVVLSGDTKYSENLINHAKHADVLIHEVAYSKDAVPEDLVGAYAHHIHPDEAAKVFNLTQPKLAVYSHIALVPGTRNKDLLSLTQKTYKGPLLIADDLTMIEIGEDVQTKKLSNIMPRLQPLYGRTKAFLSE
jgi:ribonuclease Z